MDALADSTNVRTADKATRRSGLLRAHAAASETADDLRNACSDSRAALRYHPEGLDEFENAHGTDAEFLILSDGDGAVVSATLYLPTGQVLDVGDRPDAVIDDNTGQFVVLTPNPAAATFVAFSALVICVNLVERALLEVDLLGYTRHGRRPAWTVTKPTSPQLANRERKARYAGRLLQSISSGDELWYTPRTLRWAGCLDHIEPAERLASAVGAAAEAFTRYSEALADAQA